MTEDSVDQYGDSFARDVTVEELETVTLQHKIADMTLTFFEIFDSMPTKTGRETEAHKLKMELRKHDHGLEEPPGWIFEGLLLYQAQLNHSESNCASSSEHQKTLEGLELRIKQVCNTARFAGAEFAEDITNESITHIIVWNNSVSRGLREKISWCDEMDSSLQLPLTKAIVVSAFLGSLQPTGLNKAGPRGLYWMKNVRHHSK